VRLTEELWRPGCDGGRKATTTGGGGVGLSRRKVLQGGREPWLVWIGSGDSCGGGRGVREAWGSPVASNFGGGGLTRGGVPREIRTEERAEVAGEGRWSSWVVRRC
jgi:hypothetical protein